MYSISKLKVKKGLPEVHYSISKEGVHVNYVAEMFCIVHPDLQNALKQLIPHLCFMTELVQESQLNDLEDIDEAMFAGTLCEHIAFASYNCTGISLSGDGVVLIGNKSLSTKKVLNLTSPYTLLNEDSDYQYAFLLKQAVQMVETEAELLLEGKSNAGEQLELFPEEAEAA